MGQLDGYAIPEHGDVTVYAFLEAAPGRAAELLATLSRAKAHADSDAEPGCRQYRISVDPRDTHRVCVFEVYDNKAALEFHTQTETSRGNVAFYAAGGLARPLAEQDIRVHTEYRAPA